MFKLAIVIPNYERITELSRLLDEIAFQISNDNLQDEVEICVSDDCSKNDPLGVIEEIKDRYCGVELIYNRNNKNEGMDRNFLRAVMLSDSEYCWIIGNDDLLEKKILREVIDYINLHDDTDFIVTPFDVYSDDEEYRYSINPLSLETDRRFNTSNGLERLEFIHSICHNSGIFAFLSNVIFRRSIWEERKEKFNNKIGCIFIQMYINIDKLLDNSVLYYWKKKIIKNHADDIVNNSPDRISRILVGLDGVVEYFFSGDEKAHMKKILTDAYISGLVWNLELNNEFKQSIENISSKKNELYKRYYIRTEDIGTRLRDKEVVIYGAGMYGRRALKMLDENHIRVVGVYDSNIAKSNTQFDRYTISYIDNAKNDISKGLLFVVANHDHLDEMIKKLLNYKIKDIAIIT